MANKAKHAFGMLENIDTAIATGKVDSYDILFVKDANGKPYVGWIDKDGQKVIVDDSKELAELERLLTTKANTEEIAELESKLATKASTEEVNQLEIELATKANAEEVSSKIDQSALESVSSANAYTDERFEVATSVYLSKKYEISHKPSGVLVDYRDKEIRVLCPDNTEWTHQQSGEGADANSYYIGFKAYAPPNAVSFQEDLAETISDTTMYYFENNDFAGVDENGRKYSIVWLPAAAYDESSGTWTYHGASSITEKYIGWYYSVRWYDVDGMIIATDCIRINLSNEDCHSAIKPFYALTTVDEVETAVEVKVVEVVETKVVEVVETKVVEVVEEKVTAKVEEAVSSSNSYTDEKIAEALAEMESGYEFVEF